MLPQVCNRKRFHANVAVCLLQASGSVKQTHSPDFPNHLQTRFKQLVFFAESLQISKEN